jgi:hypothetical protein
VSPGEPKIRPGAIVIHKTFGKGFVMRLDESRGYLYAEFKGEEKLFRYPQIMQTGILQFP